MHKIGSSYWSCFSSDSSFGFVPFLKNTFKTRVKSKNIAYGVALHFLIPLLRLSSLSLYVEQFLVNYGIYSMWVLCIMQQRDLLYPNIANELRVLYSHVVFYVSGIRDVSRWQFSQNRKTIVYVFTQPFCL